MFDCLIIFELIVRPELYSMSPKTTKQEQQTKLNGLKNRIIQRPPPLILDKVSNFYETNQGTSSPSSNNTEQKVPKSEPCANSSTEPDDNNVASDGGNVIGVDNPTPPVYDTQLSRSCQDDEDVVVDGAQASPSAAISRPRSSNPFLDDQDEVEATGDVAKGPGYGGDISDSSDQLRDFRYSNFQKRPASFIAATHPNKAGVIKLNSNAQSDLLSSVGDTNSKSMNQSDPTSDAIHNQFQALQLNDEHSARTETNLQQGQRFDNQHPSNNSHFIGCNDDSTKSYRSPVQSNHFSQDIYGARTPVANASDNLSHPFNELITTSTSAQNPQYINHMVQRPASVNNYEHNQPVYHNQLPQQPMNGVYINHGYSNNNEHSISLDSESAVCKPPPSAIMQLSHWSEAIYVLNNAILETSSIAGGAENGKFIYIVDSGDIILELDQIKVSGFTLLEFNELVESKSVHLMSAVQTKHSHGLTTDLKQYLNLSFPKGSDDYKLQNLIRENIYRRTIPCTTRQPKKGEIDKVDYHFLTKEQFLDLNDRGLLLECGTHAGHYYGTLKPLSNVPSQTNNQFTKQQEPDETQHTWNSNHLAIEPVQTSTASFNNDHHNAMVGGMPLYENHESLRTFQQAQMATNIMQQNQTQLAKRNDPNLTTNALPIDYKDTVANISRDNTIVPFANQASSVLSVDSESLPPGWERVVDRTHGTYYIDHNTQRTQYEQPYEIELVKSSIGFGFTLVEADNGALLVRSVIPGGPAHQDGNIRPGDILISAIGVAVTGLPHTEVARLFSTFAVGNRIKLTFARTNFLMDQDFEPDEYLFSNGANGDMAIAINNSSSHYGLYGAYNPPNMMEDKNEKPEDAQILVNQEYEYITLTIRKKDQGFGFTISDSMAGQKVRKIQNNETCGNLKQGDVLVDLDGEDIIKMKHKEVVERLKNCQTGKDVTLTVKRKKRFRSKTPMTLTSRENSEFSSLDNRLRRNCKTPNVDVMMRQPARSSSDGPSLPTSLMNRNILYQDPQQRMNPARNDPTNHYRLVTKPNSQHLIHNSDSMHHNLYQNQPHAVDNIYGQYQSLTPCATHTEYGNAFNAGKNMISSAPLFSANQAANQNISGMDQVNQFSSLMNSNRLMMMPMQQSSQHIPAQQHHMGSDYHHAVHGTMSLPLPAKPSINRMNLMYPVQSDDQYQDNFYANNEEIALQRVQTNCNDNSMFVQQPLHSFIESAANYGPNDEHDEYEYHQVDLDRESTDSNWGIRLIGGSEVDRAISIGSIVFGGVASKNGKLKSGDEIISINGINVVGATHHHVVELISACTNQAHLVIRRKKFDDACDVVLTRNLDEGFGFVIISSGNCALIGRIIEGSPADNCKQLHVRDRIIAVNGRYITPDMHHPEIVNMIKECGSTLRLRIIPVDCYTVKLIKNAQNDNFGFSMRGGSEYDGTPLYILRVAPNGLAKDLLNIGDQIIEINNISTVGMTHQQAATIIKFSDPIVKLKLRRNHVTPPSLLVDSPRALQKFNQVTAEMKTVNPPSQSSGTPNNLSQSDGGVGGGSASSEVASSTAATTASLQTQQQSALQQLPPSQQQNEQQPLIMDYASSNAAATANAYNHPLYAT